jgi:hypothetical protein
MVALTGSMPEDLVLSEEFRVKQPISTFGHARLDMEA